MDHDRCVGNPANVVVSALATDNARTRAVLATFPVITVDVLASLAIAGIGFLVFEGFLVNQVSVPRPAVPRCRRFPTPGGYGE